MTRIESRPARTGLWEYLFFVDVLGHREDTAVAAALAELASKAPFLKLLGSYPADRAASAPPASLREDDGGPA
jgi:chorismate mutase/prephenate dehydratase